MTTRKQTVNLGDIVHFMNARAPIDIFAAIVVRVTDPANDLVTLAIFYDSGITYRTDIPFADPLKEGTWCWPTEITPQLKELTSP